MKTLNIKTIDGISIITGIGKLAVCGVETRNNCKPMIEALPESDKMRVKADEGQGKLVQAAIEKKKARDYAKQNEQSASQKHATKAEKLYGAADVINDELGELKKLLVPKQQEILRNNPHFHEPGRGLLPKLGGEKWPVYLARIQPLEDLFLAKSENEQIKTDGSVVIDFRGTKYSKKVGEIWEFGTITAIDATIPKGSVRDKDLTPVEKTEIAVQCENERLAALSPEDKTSERNNAVLSLANEAQIMENQLKFSKDADFMSKAQAFYDAEIIKLNTKYGV